MVAALGFVPSCKLRVIARPWHSRARPPCARRRGRGDPAAHRVAEEAPYAGVGKGRGQAGLAQLMGRPLRWPGVSRGAVTAACASCAQSAALTRVPDGGSGRDQVTVFDGEGDQVIDRDVRPRRTYFYTFVVDPPEASHVVRMEIPTLSAEARAAIEATYASRPYTPRGASYIFIPGGPCDPVDDPGSVSSWRAGTTHGASLVGEVLGGLVADAVFTVTDLFVGDDPPDGWVEVT